MGSGGQGPRGACAGRLWSALADQAYEMSLRGRGKRRLKILSVKEYAYTSVHRCPIVAGTC